MLQSSIYYVIDIGKWVLVTASWLKWISVPPQESGSG